MLIKIRKALKNDKGFTLAELMVVVVIIGILTAIAVPVYNSVTDKANVSATEANLRTIDGAIMMYQADNDGTLPTSNVDLEGDFLQEWPTGPDGITYEISGGKAYAKKGTDTGDWTDDIDYGTDRVTD